MSAPGTPAPDAAEASDAADSPAAAAPPTRAPKPAHPARVLLSAYSGEHGVYGIVLVTALIAVGGDSDSDLEVLLFVLGTVFVFWLAHIYSSVVASRAADAPVRLRTAVAAGIRHTHGMLLAMLIPSVLLGLGAVGLIEEVTAYLLALGSGVVLLGVIGYANAARNGSTWPWRLGGVAATTFLGLFVIALSIIAH